MDSNTSKRISWIKSSKCTFVNTYSFSSILVPKIEIGHCLLKICMGCILRYWDDFALLYWKLSLPNNWYLSIWWVTNKHCVSELWSSHIQLVLRLPEPIMMILRLLFSSYFPLFIYFLNIFFISFFVVETQINVLQTVGGIQNIPC